MNKPDYPSFNHPDMVASLHEDMTPQEMARFHDQAIRVSEHANGMLMQYWLLEIAREMDQRADVKGISIAFNGPADSRQIVVTLHTEHGIINWNEAGITSLNVHGAPNPDNNKLEQHIDWFTSKVRWVPLATRPRQWLADFNEQQGPSRPILDADGVRQMSLFMLFPEPEDAERFKAQMLSLRMGSDTPVAPAKPSSQPRV